MDCSMLAKLLNLFPSNFISFIHSFIPSFPSFILHTEQTLLQISGSRTCGAEKIYLLGQEEDEEKYLGAKGKRQLPNDTRLGI